ncbi:MAG: hypothetical protein V2A73_13830 [Pseudomonadota bacterium]
MKRLLLASFLLFACNGDDDDIDVDSRAVCDCPPLNAIDVGYDNGESGLAGADLQLAVDEVAARPMGLEDAYERLFLVEDTRTSPSTGTGFSITVSCPGSPPNIALALGGSCKGPGTTAVQGTELFGLGFQCIWNKPEGEAVELTAKVTCLGKAGVSYE